MTEWIKIGTDEARLLDLQAGGDVVAVAGGFLVTAERCATLRSKLPQQSPLNRIMESLEAEAEIRVKLDDVMASPYASRPGALTAILASGRVEGGYLVTSPESYARLRATYGIEARCAGCGN